MRCSKAQLLISAAMDGEITAPEGIALGEHLDACSDCRRYQEDLLGCHRLLQESELAPSAQFEWKVQLGIRKALRKEAARDEERAPGRFWTPVGWTAALSASLVILLGLWLLPGGGGQDPAGPGPASRGWASSPLRPVATRSETSRKAFDTTPVALRDPAWRRGARLDWRTPPSLREQISTVSDLRMDVPVKVDFQPRLGEGTYVFLPRTIKVTTDSARLGKAPLRH